MKNPSSGGVPRHIAVIMDGNGRWAAARALPRTAGHGMGVRTVKQIVEACAERGIEALTLFAFSSENWQRPREEVSMLMNRFLEALDEEIESLHRNGLRLRCSTCLLWRCLFTGRMPSVPRFASATTTPR